MMIVFDLSGVFFTNGLNIAVYQISQKHNLAPEKIRFVLNGSFAHEYRTGQIKGDSFWKKAKKELKVEDIYDIKTMFFDAYEPQQSTIDLIKRLKSKNISVAYLSNSPKDRVEYLDKKHHFIALFDCGCFSFEANARKPEKEIYQKFLQKCRSDETRIIYIDDDPRNLKPAKELGMETILYQDTGQLTSSLMKAGIEV